MGGGRSGDVAANLAGCIGMIEIYKGEGLGFKGCKD